LTDEPPVDGTGLGCDVPGAKGLCIPGKTVCLGGQLVCGPVVSKSPDVCDGLDNDCDGAVDNQPDCGGPKNFLGTPTFITRGAQDTNKDLSSAITSTPCLKDSAGAIGEIWTGSKWSGSGDTAHVLFFENNDPNGGTWDLSKPGAALHLQFSTSMVSPGNPAWVGFAQPNIFLCGSGGHLRLTHSGTLLTGSAVSVDQVVPVGGGNGWVIGVNSSLDITKVKRIEIVIQPAFASPAPQFTLTFQALGFQ